MATHLAHPTIEATGGELETLRLALYPVAHLDRCESAYEAAYEGRILVDAFVVDVVAQARRKARYLYLQAVACNWADDQITKAAHQLARFDDLLDRIRPLAV
jgi:hypothetical protein